MRVGQLAVTGVCISLFLTGCLRSTEYDWVRENAQKQAKSYINSKYHINLSKPEEIDVYDERYSNYTGEAVLTYKYRGREFNVSVNSEGCRDNYQYKDISSKMKEIVKSNIKAKSDILGIEVRYNEEDNFDKYNNMVSEYYTGSNISDFITSDTKVIVNFEAVDLTNEKVSHFDGDWLLVSYHKGDYKNWRYRMPRGRLLSQLNKYLYGVSEYKTAEGHKQIHRGSIGSYLYASDTVVNLFKTELDGKENWSNSSNKVLKSGFRLPQSIPSSLGVWYKSGDSSQFVVQRNKEYLYLPTQKMSNGYIYMIFYPDAYKDSSVGVMVKR